MSRCGWIRRASASPPQPLTASGSQGSFAVPTRLVTSRRQSEIIACGLVGWWRSRADTNLRTILPLTRVVSYSGTMAPRKSKARSAPEAKLDLSGFRDVPEEKGLPLDRLSARLAARLGSGDDPYEPLGDASAPSSAAAIAIPPEPAHDGVEVTPRGILEAMLFVGGLKNEPLARPAWPS